MASSYVKSLAKSYETGLGSAARASVRRKKKGKPKKGARADAPPPPTTKEGWEFPRDKLSDLHEVGQGNFGLVYKAQAEGIVPGQRKSTVAIKTLATEVAEDENIKDEFMSEVKIMMDMNCDNVVRLLGVCTDKQPFYMIMEFLPKGDLKDVLTKNRPMSDRPAPFGQKRLALMGAGIAEGMHFLGTMTIVHRDLAARNCLVGEGLQVKIGDFGLTRKTYSKDYYRMKNAAPLPIRWMAIESLYDGVFTCETDLWSFGIVLWEIATFGKVPYASLDNEQVVDRVCEDDYRMPAPAGCPPGFYKIMVRCWEEAPADRGTFADSKVELLALAEKLSDAAITRDMFNSDAGGDEPDEDLSAYDQVDVAGEDGEDGYAVPRASEAGGRPKSVVDDAMDINAVCSWVASTAGRPVDASNIHESLKDGVTLCLLMNKLKSGSIRKFSEKKKHIHMTKNISSFLSAVAAYGVSSEDLFDIDDLLEDDDPFRVAHCLMQLKQKVDAQ